MSKVIRKNVKIFVICVTVGASVLFLCATQAESSSDRQPKIAQITAAVKSSILLTTISSKVETTLREITNPAFVDLTGPSTFGACDPFNYAKLALSPKPCFFGNLYATNTIVMIGDSNAGNWIPALNLGLENSSYRLAVFGFSSCGLANLPYTASWGSLYERCRLWHQNVPAAIRALHPVAVIAASGDVGSNYSNTTWANGVKNVFDEATKGSPATKRILMGTSPFFSESVVTCLTIHSNPKDCSLKFSPGIGYYGSVLSRDKLVAHVSSAALINTSQFFCFSGICPPVIDNILVYSDIDHVTVAYSSFISNAITRALLRALVK